MYTHFLVSDDSYDFIGVFGFQAVIYFVHFFFFIINSYYSLGIQWNLYSNYFLLFYNSCSMLFSINIDVSFHICFSSSVFLWNVSSGLVVSKIPGMVVTCKPKENWIQCINCKKWAHDLWTPEPNNLYICQNCETAL